MTKEKLVLLHSNDMHGDFLAEPKEGFHEGGVPLLSGFIRKVRSEEDKTDQVAGQFDDHAHFLPFPHREPGDHL